MPKLDGLYTYSVQGFMHAPKLYKNDETDPKEQYYLHGGGNLEVNLAHYKSSSDPYFQPRPAKAPPAIAGFFSPSDTVSPSYQIDDGFYPFSEIGFMVFTPGAPSTDGLDNDGAVEGWRMINTSGYAGTTGSCFKGSYKFMSIPGKGKQPGSIGNYKGTLPVVGAITTQIVTMDGKGMANHVWDYIFVMVTDNELQLTANGRLPRPGVATGVMEKADEAK